MPKIEFTAAGVLLEDDRELGRIGPSESGAYAAVVIGDRLYEIVRKGHAGWHFGLLEANGAGRLCEFHPAWLGAGGKLIAATRSLKLRERLLVSRTWNVTSSDGLRVNVKAGPGRGGRVEGGRRIAVLGPGIRPELTLTLSEPISSELSSLAMLLFACWLIAEWEMAPGGEAARGFVGGP